MQWPLCALHGKRRLTPQCRSSATAIPPLRSETERERLQIQRSSLKLRQGSQSQRQAPQTRMRVPKLRSPLRCHWNLYRVLWSPYKYVTKPHFQNPIFRKNRIPKSWAALSPLTSSLCSCPRPGLCFSTRQSWAGRCFHVKQCPDSLCKLGLEAEITALTESLSGCRHPAGALSLAAFWAA